MDNKKAAKKKPVSKIILTIIILIIIILATALIYNYVASKDIVPTMASREMMSTLVTQQVYSKDKKLATRVIKEVFIMIKDMENSYSIFMETSEVSKINENAGIGFVKVQKEIFDLIKRSKNYGILSDGDFDITIAPVTKAWGITGLNPRVIGEEEREKLLKLVGYNKIILDEENSAVMLMEKGMELDLGAIAKGEACTEAKKIYEKYDFEGVLLSVGGNILAIGSPNREINNFSIAIRDPGKKETGIIGVLKSSNTTISTSGSYERFFEKDGEIYHHIFDPKTAYPAVTDLVSVSIICENGAYAEYLSTNIFVKGKENLLSLLEDKTLDYEIIGVDKEDNIYLSKSLKKKFTPEKGTKYTYIFN